MATAQHPDATPELYSSTPQDQPVPTHQTTAQRGQPVPTESDKPALAPARPSPTTRRMLIASVLLLAFVLAIVLNPDSTRVQASGLFGGLRAPGEAGFVAGHRGDRAVGPENTMPALRAALEGPMAFVEVDVRLSADGVPVLMHDQRVERTTDGTGRVSDLDFAELQALDAGSWFAREFAGTRIPPLEEFLGALRETDKKCLLELKGHWTPQEARIVADMIGSHGLRDRVVVASFDMSTLQNIEAADAGLPRVVITSSLPRDPVAFAQLYGAVAIVTNHASVAADPGSVDRMHQAGLGLVLYTLNSKTHWKAAMDLGVDGIITDRPGRLDSWFAAVSVRD